MISSGRSSGGGVIGSLGTGPRGRLMRLVASVLALSALSAGVAATSIAHADDQPDPTGKGIAGGILLGSEVVLAVEAAIDVEPTWAYVVGGLAGAAGGGVAGYYIEQDANPKLPLLMLASGMALAIPTTVAVLSATAYEPPNDYVEGEKPSDEPVADPPRPVGATPTSGAVRRRRRRSSQRRTGTDRRRARAASRSASRRSSFATCTRRKRSRASDSLRRQRCAYLC